jgi:predicted ATPase
MLKLNNLKIQNFRLLENLEIEQLGQVNLIVGKNNMGKSTVLEALRIYASLGSPHLLEKLLDSHDETVDILPTEGILPVEKFFTGMCFPKPEIYIGNVEKTSYVSMKPVYFIFEEQPDGNLTSHRIRKEIDDIDITIYEGVRQALKIRYKNDRLKQALFNYPPSMWLDFQSYDRNDYELVYIQLQKMGATFPYGYVSTDVIPSSDLSGTWDNFSLTHRQHMIEGLKLIDPSIEDLGFKEKRNSIGVERVPIVKKQGQDKTVPLKSSGDGILRILQLILSLMQAKDGFLLIDEFENGLHYSVQREVWKLIFKLAKELNVQVFATTHSWDCITAFQQTSQDFEAEAILFRLGCSAKKSHRGQVIALVYDKQRLQKVTQVELEVR